MSGYAWMPERKGAVSGFVVAGFGAGAAVFDAVATAVVNPNNVPPDPDTGYYGEVRWVQEEDACPFDRLV